jgi:regulator of sigma E protease
MSLLIFFVVLVILILVHEFGHFIVAKKSGIRVDEFGIGFPPKLFGKKIGETEYTINALPIGGFVRIWGEDPTEEHYGENEESERSFVKQPKYIQALVLVAGVSMNILLAFFLYSLSFMIGLPTAASTLEEAANLEDARLLITEIMPNSPASEGLQESDEIQGVTRSDSILTSDTALSPEDVSTFITNTPENEGVLFKIMRRGETQYVTIHPQKGVFEDNPEKVAAGFSMSLAGTQSYPFFTAIWEGAKRTYNSFGMVLSGLWQLASGNASFSQVSGPVGIVGLVGDAAALGLTWLLTFSAFISLNLAVINLLPLPALDGGRLVFVAVEAITRKPINPVFATRVNQIGFIALLSLMFVVTVHDIIKLF